MSNEVTFNELDTEVPARSILNKAAGGLRALLGKRPKAPVAVPETDVDILLEDTIHGVTVRFTGKDDA